MRQRPKSEGGTLIVSLSTPLRAPRSCRIAFDIAWIGATQPERLPPLAATGGGRGGCQQPRRGTFLRASLTAYNPKGDTLRTERSMLQCGLAISITALTVLGMAITVVAAPYTPKSGQCYSACEAKCAAQHSCERSAASRDCFTHYNQCKAACRSSCCSVGLPHPPLPSRRAGWC